MSEPKHYQGWITWTDCIAPRILLMGGNKHMTGPVYKDGAGEAEANHDRLVACWNA